MLLWRFLFTFWRRFSTFQNLPFSADRCRKRCNLQLADLLTRRPEACKVAQSFNSYCLSSNYKPPAAVEKRKLNSKTKTKKLASFAQNTTRLHLFFHFFPLFSPFAFNSSPEVLPTGSGARAPQMATRISDMILLYCESRNLCVKALKCKNKFGRRKKRKKKWFCGSILHLPFAFALLHLFISNFLLLFLSICKLTVLTPILHKTKLH